MATPNEGPPGARWLSLVEMEVVAVLADAGGWLRAADIAQALGRAPSSELRFLLGNLVDRGVLRSHNRRGYCLPDVDNVENVESSYPD